MSGRLNIVAQLIRDREFDVAKQMLVKEGDNAKALYLLSLLYRYNDDYDAEKQAIDRLLKLDEQNAYAQERLKWHALPLFDRLVPRQPLSLPRDPKMIPSQAVLEQLCFVTAGGSDSPYFELMIGLIESLKNTRLYKDIPICILDAGLSEEHKNFLLKIYSNITITDPGWDIDITISGYDFMGKERPLNGFKGCSARPFIPKHFPEFRYYIWLDTDVWVQDERSLDALISSTVMHGVCAPIVRNSTGGRWAGSWWNKVCQDHKLIPEEYLPVLEQAPYLTAGLLCVDKMSGFFDLWANYMKESVDYSGQIWGPDELTFVYTYQKHFTRAPHLDFHHNYSLNTAHGKPVFLDNCLVTPYSAEIIGTLHFVGIPKDQWFIQLMEVDRVALLGGQGKKQEVTQSLHYRIWPWADKPEILQKLIKESEVRL